MLEPILILTGWTVLVAAAAFALGFAGGATLMFDLSEGAESNVVQLRREG